MRIGTHGRDARASGFITIFTQIHFGQSPSVKIECEKRNQTHSAPAWYTLRAGKGKTQINRAQFRAKSAAPGVVNEGETEAGSSCVVTPGSAQATDAGAIREKL